VAITQSEQASVAVFREFAAERRLGVAYRSWLRIDRATQNCPLWRAGDARITRVAARGDNR
jgi:hypothetical protein